MGLAEAQYELDFFYRRGGFFFWGAARWNCADAAGAKFNLSCTYRNGGGVEQDYAESARRLSIVLFHAIPVSVK
jgi:hypothetical protein